MQIYEILNELKQDMFHNCLKSLRISYSAFHLARSSRLPPKVFDQSGSRDKQICIFISPLGENDRTNS